ncbi:MAG: alginate lyase family protein, partial [Planctomycetota bacterium]|nr:alginate lyase family protein [Planctomycetota bacterium]
MRQVLSWVASTLLAAIILFFFAPVWAAPAATAPVETAKGPRLTDAQFFQMLDLSRPDMAAEKAAVEKSDWPAAKHALAEHLRSRTSPHWTFDPRKIGSDRKGGNSGAENALKHRLSSIGIPWQFGPEIDWAFNPTTQPDSKWPVNHEWTWQLSRHAAWLDLARAYMATGDEKYAREFVDELRGWVRDCPVPVEAAANVPLSRWRTIEAGIRMYRTWPGTFFGFLHAKAMDDDALVLMVKSCVEHAQYLMKFHMHGNWLTMESNGLYHVGALFPEFKDAALWRETGAGRLYKELDVQVYPDGAQMELAPGYHGVALDSFLGPVRLVPLTGFELPKDYLAKLERMFNYFLYSMQPTRQMPPLNDSGANDVQSWMAQGTEFFPARDDFRWVATDGKQGKPPAQTSYEFPYAGQLFMRSGWDRQAAWLCMDAGPYGMGHQHEDKLSVILTAFGKPLLVEGGVYTYDASVWRKYVLGSRAHNVVLVDGLEQARRKSPSETWVVKTPLAHVWKTGAQRDDAEAAYDEGWGAKAERSVRQARHVTFIKPDFFIVTDVLESLDGKPHQYEALFHLDA